MLEKTFAIRINFLFQKYETNRWLYFFTLLLVKTHILNAFSRSSDFNGLDLKSRNILKDITDMHFVRFRGCYANNTLGINALYYTVHEKERQLLKYYF